MNTLPQNLILGCGNINDVVRCYSICVVKVKTLYVLSSGGFIIMILYILTY